MQASLTLDESNLNASGIGDISTDDNAVDMPMKSEEDPVSLGLTNNNDRIPILDDDDDVVILPQEEPIITEIPDDDDPEHKNASTLQDCNSQGESLVKQEATHDTDAHPDREGMDDEGLFITHSILFLI